MKISVWEVIFNYLLPRQACKTNLITCNRQAADLHLKSCVHRVTCGSDLRLKGKKKKSPKFPLACHQRAAALSTLPGEANAFAACPTVMTEKPEEKFNQGSGWDESKCFWSQEYWVQCTGWIDTLCSICQFLCSDMPQNVSYWWLYFHLVVQKDACCWIMVMKMDSLTVDGLSWKELNLGLRVSSQERVGCSFVYLSATGLHCNP